MTPDLMQSDATVLAAIAALIWLALAVTSVRRARKGGDS